MFSRLSRLAGLVSAGTLIAGSASVAQDLTGAGATFPAPIYDRWRTDYAAKTGVKINYQPIGSGGGIRQVTAQTVFFGATDGPMTQEQILAAPSKILHLPTVIGADVPVYNLPGVSGEIKFTGAVLADIFLGKITKWDDPALVKLNAGSSHLVILPRKMSARTAPVNLISPLTPGRL